MKEVLFTEDFTSRKLCISDEIKLFNYKKDLEKYNQMLYYKTDMVNRKNDS